ncbi:MAG: ATP-binding protein [Archangium sp.]|nr:ATP-binding protein [Archangium sp.]MDP3570594.1 ATP-binding protein [Archangium sp.]
MTGEATRQWDKPEVGARLLKTFLLSFEKRYGRARLEALWAERPMPLSLEYLAGPNNFVSLDFLELLLDELVRGSGDPDFMIFAASNIATPEALGFAYYILRSVGSPGLAYRKSVEFSPTYNRAGRFAIERESPWSMTLTYTSGRPERNRNSCIGRMANYAAFPSIWDLPPAQVIELQCQVNGADCCRYELTWQNPKPGTWRRWVGAALGAALAPLAAHFGHFGLLETLASFIALGFGYGGWSDVRRLSAQKESLLEQTTHAMRQSMDELQERAAEAFRVNVQLDQRVTERTSELSAALERLRQLDALKSEFFANVSHELRTPLTLILAPLDDRLGRDVPAEERRLLEGLRRNSWRLLRLIDDLLDLSRIDAGQLRLDHASLDMGAMARQLGVLFASAAEARGLELKVEGLESTSDLWGDSHRLDSALSNLLGNAFKFTPSGGKVTLRVEETPGEVRVTVQDTGPGIAAADLTRIFERYYQADEASGRRVGGVGIGLALARNLVELHGGRLEVTSEVGQGAAFTIVLPRGKGHIKPEALERRQVQLEGSEARRASDAELEVIAPDPRGPLGSAPQATSGAIVFDGGRRARVLVVEDNPDVRAMLVDLLSVSFDVLVAADGLAGLESVKRQRPELVLSDVMMPGLSGTQLCKAIKADPVIAATPVILLTARGGTDAAIEGFASGADEFVEKPFHPRVLVARVQAQLRLRSLSLQVTASARLAAVGTLAAGVGHEVRNPVNAVLNGVRALQARPGLDESDTQLLAVIAEGAQRIDVISGALLTHVSPGDGGGVRPVDPRAGLDSTVRLLQHRLLDVQVHRDYADVQVVASAAELNQVFVNLIDNAIRAPARNVWLSIKEVGERVEISVADDGPGVPEEIASRLFDPFFTTRAPGEGTGLGLYLSRQSLLRWGGDLRFSPRPGGGTSFTAALPRGTR